MVRLVCGHRGRRDGRRPVTILSYAGPLPVPDSYSPRGRAATLELRCRYCGLAPRPGDAGLRMLLNAAAALPGRRLDLSAGATPGRPRCS